MHSFLYTDLAGSCGHGTEGSFLWPLPQGAWPPGDADAVGGSRCSGSDGGSTRTGDDGARPGTAPAREFTRMVNATDPREGREDGSGGDGPPVAPGSPGGVPDGRAPDHAGVSGVSAPDRDTDPVPASPSAWSRRPVGGRTVRSPAGDRSVAGRGAARRGGSCHAGWRMWMDSRVEGRHSPAADGPGSPFASADDRTAATGGGRS
jgi:hypothetical protein